LSKVGILVLFLNSEEYRTGPSEILYSKIDRRSKLDKPSHPVKLAENCEEFAPNTVKSESEFTIDTAGELGVRNPALLTRATRSDRPALVIVAGKESGMVNTESMMWMRPPT
jgi:hypothetical protein